MRTGRHDRRKSIASHVLAVTLIVIGVLAPANALGAGKTQNGLMNYAGPDCPGREWNCTSQTDDISQTGQHNLFDCRSSACKVDQHATDGGSNEAMCAQAANKPRAQTCEIGQTNDRGSNTIEVDQTAGLEAKGGTVTQSSTQTLMVTQANKTGRNSLVVHQAITQSARNKGKNGKPFHEQEAAEYVQASQTSTSGLQTTTIDQMQDLRSQASAKKPTTQRQNATDNGADLSAKIFQHTGSGTNDLATSQHQRLAQSTNAKHAVQTQGAGSGGTSFDGDIDSDGQSGGSSDVRVDQVEEWTQEGPPDALQDQLNKVKVRLIPLTLTPDTVRARLDTTLHAGPSAAQRCEQSAEIHARVNGIADLTCTLDTGTGAPFVAHVHEEGTSFVVENTAPVDAASVTGRVTASGTSRPIAGATVQLIGTGLSATTRSDGSYVITQIDPGTYTLQASAPGFQTTSRQITLASGERQQDDFVLTR